MARRREFNDEAALGIIENIFWEKGYEGTSYAHLTDATGLGKASLYAAYGNKKALYIKALESYIAREVELLGALMMERYENEPSAWKECLKLFFDTAIEAVSARQDRRGCFLCNAAVDLAPFDASVEQTVLEALGKVKGALAVLLRHSHNKQTDALVEHFLAVYIGMRVMAKAGATPMELALARDATLSSA